MFSTVERSPATLCNKRIVEKSLKKRSGPCFPTSFQQTTKRSKKGEPINKNAFPKNEDKMLKDFTPSQPTCFVVLVMFGSSPLHKESNTVHVQVTDFDPDK